MQGARKVQAAALRTVEDQSRSYRALGEVLQI
jgi:hypothetical protein